MTPLKLQKPKRSLKDRIKSFFHVDIEKDLQEEEESPKFEKVPVIKLTRNKIFLAIFAFLIIVNVLVGFDINQFYIRAILGFIFLITVPGLLIMLCFKIRTVKFWEFLVYTIGLSVAFIMFAGLAVNWTLPALGITDKPLSLYPILICFDIFLVVLGIVAWKRNKDFPLFTLTVPRLDAINNIFFIIPMAFPVLAILGAFLLNNHGSNILTMIMLGGIAVYVLLLVIFRKKLDKNIWPWAILMISLSLLLSFSLRSWYISGWDISQEQYVFRLASENKIWSMSSYRNAYNSCLSLSILPTTILNFVSINNQLIFKLLIQIIFIFHSLTIFLIFRRYISSIFSFIASFLYFGAGYFNSTFPTLIRQEVGFIFFGLMLLVLFTREVNPLFKKALFLIFGVSIIVSHYSTADIALTILTLTYILTFFYKRYENKKVKKDKIHLPEKTEFFITGFLILLLLISGFLWMSQLTDTSNGVIYTIKTTINNIGSSFSFDSKESTVKDALFKGINSEGYKTSDLYNYINKTLNSINQSEVYSSQKNQLSNLEISQNEIISPINNNLAYGLFYLYQIIKYTLILSFIVGFILLLKKQKKIDMEFLFMILLSIIFILSLIILPYLSQAYNFERAFQQSLIFLSLSSIIVFHRKFNRKKTFLIIPLVIYLIYSFFNLGFVLALMGGNPTPNLYNFGNLYNTLYAHRGEIISIGWFGNNYEQGILYADPFSTLKFYSFGDPTVNPDRKVIPSLMKPSAYVYSSYSNTIKRDNYLDAREMFNKGIVPFNFPIEFLNEHKDRIYNNGYSNIYK